MASAARRPERFLRSNRREGPDWPSALISLSMSYSTRRIEKVAPSIKRDGANLPTMICANRLAPAVLFSTGCAGLPAATHRCCDPRAAATSEISPSHSPAGSGRMTRYSETVRIRIHGSEAQLEAVATQRRGLAAMSKCTAEGPTLAPLALASVGLLAPPGYRPKARPPIGR